MKLSRTALSAALARAAHIHMYEAPYIHKDDWAIKLAGSEVDEMKRALEKWGHPMMRRYCAYFAYRQKYAEENLIKAISSGAQQVVILGAGLDSFAIRYPNIVARTVYVEVDRKEMLEWKQKRLFELKIETPHVLYVNEEVWVGSINKGLKTFFSWMGVTQYNTREENDRTFRCIQEFPQRSSVVFDVVQPVKNLPMDEKFLSVLVSSRAKQSGEPYKSEYKPVDLARRLSTMGYPTVVIPSADQYYKGQPKDVRPLQAFKVMKATV